MIDDQAISTMFDINIFFHMVKIVLFRIETKTLGCTTIVPGCDRDYYSSLWILVWSSRWYSYYHIDPLCFGLWLCFSHGVTPLCIFCGCIFALVMEVWIQILLVLSISLVDTRMDP